MDIYLAQAEELEHEFWWDHLDELDKKAYTRILFGIHKDHNELTDIQVRLCFEWKHNHKEFYGTSI